MNGCGQDDVQSKWSDLAEEWEEGDAKVLLDIYRVVGDSERTFHCRTQQRWRFRTKNHCKNQRASGLKWAKTVANDNIRFTSHFEFSLSVVIGWC